MQFFNCYQVQWQTYMSDSRTVCTLCLKSSLNSDIVVMPSFLFNSLASRIFTASTERSVCISYSSCWHKANATRVDKIHKLYRITNHKTDYSKSDEVQNCVFCATAQKQRNTRLKYTTESTHSAQHQQTRFMMLSAGQPAWAGLEQQPFWSMSNSSLVHLFHVFEPFFGPVSCWTICG